MGDSPSDLEAANAIGCRAYLVAPRAGRAAMLAAAERGALRVDGTAESLQALARRFLLPLAAAAPR